MEGSVAAPTAGLHFTESWCGDASGRSAASVTLHVGRARSCRSRPKTPPIIACIRNGAGERRTAARSNATQRAGGRIVAVGSTSLRLIERRPPRTARCGLLRRDGDVHHAGLPLQSRRYPAHQLSPAALDAVHAGRAFCGLDVMRPAYAHAIDSGYRFYSYGDACLLFRAN